ncbi:hypothetical protein Aduo_005324 [Ancylostoma duodenale]
MTANCDRCYNRGRHSAGMHKNSGQRTTTMRQEYHSDMNQFMFEELLTQSLPCMQSVAGERPILLAINNAPYHSRQLEKVVQPC